MDMKLLEQTVMDVLVREIVQRVWDKLLATQKRALVVCTGAALGYGKWIDSLQRLQRSGFTFDLLLSESALRVLNIEHLTASLDFGSVWREGEPGWKRDFVNNYPTVIVPALTVNTAAKLASCIADTAAVQTIQASLMKNKNVVIAVNGCCPQDSERRAMGYTPLPALEAKLSDNVQVLKSYGAYLATVETLAERTIKLIESAKPVFQSRSGASGQAETRADAGESLPKAEAAWRIAIDNRVISQRDLARLPRNSTLVVAENSIITQLAMDTARAKAISIVKS